MVARLWRVFLQIGAPLLRAEEAEWWGRLLWQVLVFLGLGAGALSFLSHSPFAILLYSLLILLGLTFAAAYRLQVQTEPAYIRRDLLDARKSLGHIISDAGDLLIGKYGNRPFDDQAFEIFSQTLELFRSGNSVFDDSHEGRFYAATTAAQRRAVDDSDESARDVLQAQIKCLNDFVSEINDDLNTLPRVR